MNYYLENLESGYKCESVFSEPKPGTSLYLQIPAELLNSEDIEKRMNVMPAIPIKGGPNMNLARRIPFALVLILSWLVHTNKTIAQNVRYEARTADGQKMLKVYANAVGKMKATSAANPNSWIFQWYTHAVRSDRTKTAEIMAIFGAGGGPEKILAESMWDTCQPHLPPNVQDDFLPWHRMFIYYFEEIIRDVSGEKMFTLPYWNYSADGRIPPEFTKKNDPLFQSLFIENRNTGVNAGQPIDKGHPAGTLNPSELAECFYDPASSVHPGFCMKLNLGLHGTVHVLVGDGKNMGSVPWAANDPIFWLHHCNIDRLWASWNAAGRSNPSGMGSYTFAENKMKVVADVATWMDPETKKHGYAYDKLETVLPCRTTKAILTALAQNQKRVAAMKEKEIKLGLGPTKVSLPLESEKEGVKPKAFTERVKAMPKDKHLYLIVKNLKADAPPGVLYQLYLDLPPDTQGEKAAPHLVGSLNFFDAVKHGNGGHAMKEGKEPFFSFDITSIARQLQASNLLAEQPVLTIAPVGQPAETANPVIADISIVEQ